MSSTTAIAARCTSCRQAREAEDLLLVWVNGRPAYAVCRPTVDPHCFPRVTGPRQSERIEPLVSYLARRDAAQPDRSGEGGRHAP